MPYENIVSNLHMFLRKYSVISLDQERERPPPSIVSPGQHGASLFLKQRVAGLPSGALTDTCLQTVSTTEIQGVRKSAKINLLFTGGVHEGSRSVFPVGFQGTSQGLRQSHLLKANTGPVTLHTYWLQKAL